MKPTVIHKEELTSITPILISSTTNSKQLFNHVINIATDHDVKVTNTMIKVTYKKPLKDFNSSSPTFRELNIFKDSFENNMIKFMASDDLEELPSSSKELTSSNKRKESYINGDFKYKDSDKDDDNSIDVLNQTKVVKKLKVSKEGKIQSIKFLKSVRDSDNSFTEYNKDVFKPKNDKLKNKIVIKRNLVGTKIKKIEGKPTKIKSLSVNENSETKTIETQKVDEISSRKPILLVDPDLPKGWSRYIRTKDKGSSDEKHIVYVVSPQGKKFRYKWKLKKYLDKTQSDLDINRFFFGLYKRKSQGGGAEEKGSPEKLSSSNNTESPHQKNYFNKKYGKVITNREMAVDADGRELLLHDPDLPFGWRRIITSDPASSKMRVHIISPEGTIFRRKYRLLEYLAKHEYSYSPDRFYFGLYSKEENSNNSGDNEESNITDDDSNMDEDIFSVENDESEKNITISEGSQKPQEPLNPMYEDPNLPEGWKRTIKVRKCGETAGRMEVIIISPDGRKHRNRAHLEHYLARKSLNYNSEDFDFTVYGKSKKRQVSVSEPKDTPVKPKKKHLKASKIKPVQDLDLKKVKEPKITPIGQLVNSVNGLMVSCGLSSTRNERRLRLPRNVLEKNIKKHLESETVPEITEVNAQWVQSLAKCRAEFRTLEPDAASLIADQTKLFIQKLAAESFKFCANQEEGLEYEDIAEVVDKLDCLTPLKTLIPKKITYKEFVKLNRPKHFMSFT